MAMERCHIMFCHAFCDFSTDEAVATPCSLFQYSYFPPSSTICSSSPALLINTPILHIMVSGGAPRRLDSSGDTFGITTSHLRKWDKGTVHCPSDSLQRQAHKPCPSMRYIPSFCWHLGAPSPSTGFHGFSSSIPILLRAWVRQQPAQLCTPIPTGSPPSCLPRLSL